MLHIIFPLALIHIASAVSHHSISVFSSIQKGPFVVAVVECLAGPGILFVCVHVAVFFARLHLRQICHKLILIKHSSSEEFQV